MAAHRDATHDVPGDEQHPEPTASASPGGGWLTYRYRFGRAASVEASGTIKAPSFLAAARRLATERLYERLSAVPAYLRLRAAGEAEVWFEVARAAGDDAGSPPRVTALPAAPEGAFGAPGDDAPDVRG
jgi:hypothetical protein